MQEEARCNPLDELNTRPEEAMQELIERYTSMVCSIAGRYLQNAEDVKDVVSETFAEVYACRKSYDPASGSLSTWIGTIARNISVSLYRKNKDFLYYKGRSSDGSGQWILRSMCRMLLRWRGPLPGSVSPIRG